MDKKRSRMITADGVLSGIVERDIPIPKPDELLIRIHATSVNYHDVSGIDGFLRGLPIPRVPFSDASATVLQIGADVTGFAVGDAVIPGFFPNWQRGPVALAQVETILGDQIDGTLQTHLCVPARSVARAPKNLSHEEIATLGCAGLTAWRSIVVEAQIKPGQTILLQGTGGVSLAALALGRTLGAKIIITSSSDEKLARARELGAHETINYRTTPDWDHGVLELTDGAGVDLVVEVGGSLTLTKSVNAVKTGGHISIIGILTGHGAGEFPLFQVLKKNATIRGITVGSTSDLDDMCRAIEVNGYKPIIDTLYDLDTAHEAVAQLRKQGHFGKLVIRIS